MDAIFKCTFSKDDFCILIPKSFQFVRICYKSVPLFTKRTHVLTPRSPQVSKPRDWMLQWSYHSEICQAFRRRCCRGACLFSERLDKSELESRGFEAARSCGKTSVRLVCRGPGMVHVMAWCGTWGGKLHRRTYESTRPQYVNTGDAVFFVISVHALRTRQNGHRFAVELFKLIFLNGNCGILIPSPLQLAPQVSN